MNLTPNRDSYLRGSNAVETVVSNSSVLANVGNLVEAVTSVINSTTSTLSPLVEEDELAAHVLQGIIQ